MASCRAKVEAIPYHVLSAERDTSTSILGDFVITAPAATSHVATPTVAWNAAEGAVMYHVAISASADCTGPIASYDVKDTSLVVSSPLPDGIYHVCVKALDGAGGSVVASNNGHAFNVKTAPPGAFTITAPSGFIDSSSLVASWTAASDAQSYSIIVASDAACAKGLQTITGVTDTLTAVPSLPDGSYYICVSADDGFGHQRLATNSGFAFTVDTTPPGSFRVTGPSGLNPATPLATWTSAVGAASYTLAVTSDATCNTAVQTYPNLSGTSQILNRLDGGTYYLCVKALDLAGNVTTATNNGQAFSVPQPFVLGQADAQSNANLALGVSGPQGIYTDGTRFFVADTYNNRVLIWNSLPTSQRRADVVLGSSSFDYPSFSGVSASTLSKPQAIYSDGTRLFVADTGNNRILIWSSMPTTNGQPADLVLGQPDMQTKGAPASIDASHFASVWSLSGDGTHLILVDRSADRVLIWTQLPTINNQTADIVIGQNDFTSSAFTSVCDAKSFADPVFAIIVGGRILVADEQNARVLVWNSVPSANGQSADYAIGETSTTDCSGAFSGSTNAPTLYSPISIASDGTRLYIDDLFRSRVLRWDTIPTTSGVAANLVLGQPDMVSSAPGISASSLIYPASVATDGNKVFVANEQSPVLVWNSLPSSNGAAASFALGQPTMSEAVVNSGEPRNAAALAGPEAMASDGTHLVVADTNNNRVLIWNSLPISAGVLPDVVVGQPDMTTTGAGTNDSTLSSPMGVALFGSRLVVADRSNNRVLIWNSIPTTNGAAADVVLGQTSMTTSAQGAGASGLYFPQGVFSDGHYFYVADSFNNRVLVWNNFPTANNQSADFVLGQTDFNNAGGACGPSSMNNPVAVTSMGGRLLVTDQNNNRVLVWNALPTVTGQPADLAIGQPDLNTASPDVSAVKLNTPAAAFSDGSKLFVSDQVNNRVLVWNSLPVASGMAADIVVGQPNFTSSTMDSGGLNITSLAEPSGLYSDGLRLYVTDMENNRVVSVARP